MFVENDPPLSQLYCEVSDIVSDACGNRSFRSLNQKLQSRS